MDDHDQISVTRIPLGGVILSAHSGRDWIADVKAAKIAAAIERAEE